MSAVTEKTAGTTPRPLGKTDNQNSRAKYSLKNTAFAADRPPEAFTKTSNDRKPTLTQRPIHM